MLKNYLKIAFRNLIKDKIFSIVNIFGFAFSIAVCIMIILSIMKEESYDKFNVDADRIYKLINLENNSSSIDYKVRQVILNNFSEVKNCCIVQGGGEKVEVSRKTSGYYVDNILSVDNAFFKMFSVHFIYGNSTSPFKDINSAVLTESVASKFFGDENPLGKEIFLRDKFPIIVTGVIKDLPDNSSIKADIIVNAANNNFKFNYMVMDNSYTYFFNIFIQLHKNANIKQLKDEVSRHSEVLAPYLQKTGFFALKDLHLYDNTSGNILVKGNPAFLRLLTSIALIILLLAIVNYINLTVAQQFRRKKETGIRKTVGATRKDIVILFLTESILTTFIAFIIALCIVEVGLSFFEKIVENKLSLIPLLQFPTNIILILSVLFIGILSGLAPALLFSSFSPVRIFSGSAVITGRKSYLRNIMTMFQFTVSIALIFCLIIVQKQINYVKHQNLGFDKSQLLRLDLITPSDSKAYTFTNELKQYSSIVSATASCGVPGITYIKIPAGDEKKKIFVNCIIADSTFIRTFKIELIKGRELLPGDFTKSCMINETAYKNLGWNNLDDEKRIYNGREGGYKVIGVVKDFHFASLHKPIEPLCIMFDTLSMPSNVTVRIRNGNVGQTMEFISKLWKEIYPAFPLKYQFYDQWFNEMYRKDERFAELIDIFALLAISISSLGILGLVTFASERRTKEIGIRKVHGASTSELMIMLSKDFLKWILVAILIASPIGWYAMRKWLQDFAYRTEINWWVFALAGLIALLIAFITICWQIWKTAKRNPVEVLRYE